MIKRSHHKSIRLYLYSLQQSKLTHLSYTNSKMLVLFLHLAKLTKDQSNASNVALDLSNSLYNLRRRLENKQKNAKMPSLTPLKKLLTDIEDYLLFANESLTHCGRQIEYLMKSLKLTTLKIQHFVWWEQFYMAALQGTLSEFHYAERLRHCQLYQWCQSNESREFHLLQEFVRLCDLQDKLHETGCAVIALYGKTSRPPVMIKAFQRIELLSQGVVQALDNLDDLQLKQAEKHQRNYLKLLKRHPTISAYFPDRHQ